MLKFIITLGWLIRLVLLCRSTFRDEIIPHAVSWFTGEAIPEVDFDSSDDGEDDNQEESDDA